MNTLKKQKIIGAFLVFLICFGLHFLFDWLPNIATSIIAPVNESIWEHMKLIFFSYVLYGCIEYFFLKKENTTYPNFLFQLWIIPTLAIPIYLLIYLPLFFLFKENMIISISLLALIIILEEVLSYKLLQRPEKMTSNLIPCLGILIVTLLFTLLTYKPLENFLFYDQTNHYYGIKK